MIDVSEYIQKLELLKQYISERVDERLPITIDMRAIPKLNIDEVIKIYDQTGILYCHEWEDNSKPISFEEYYNIKSKQ